MGLGCLVALSSACGSDPGPGEAFEVTIEWQPCSFFTDGDDSDAMCATPSVPLSWSDPDLGTIELFLKRVGAESPERSVWLLAGGPGEASAGYESLAQLILEDHPELAVYLLDHRGTGRSSRLGCPVQEDDGSPGGARIVTDEWPACIAALQEQWPTELPHFRSREAATDVGRLIEATNQGEPVHVHGTSYGTYLVNQYLHQFPEQPTSVSYLGIAPPDITLADYDASFDAVGSTFLSRCAADPVCSSRLGNDPDATMHTAFDTMPCAAAVSAGLTRDNLRAFASVALLGSWSDRLVPLAAAYRILRCNASDQVALGTLGSRLVALFEKPLLGDLFSTPLGRHISLSELWSESGPSLAEAQALVDGSLWASGSTLSRVELESLWPTYEVEPESGVVASFDGPMLFLNGELDPATPAPGAASLAQSFSGPNQTYVEIPGGSHSLLSPMADGTHCALERLEAFIVAPFEVPADCSAVLPLSFSGTAELAAAYFGTTDIWD